MQQVWGLGVPLWQLPFEAVGRLVGVSPFPDRVAMLVWLTLVVLRDARARRRVTRRTSRGWIGAGSVVITRCCPAVVAMMRGRIDVYEEAAIYAYGAAMMLLGGLVAASRASRRARATSLLLAAAGATGLDPPDGVVLRPGDGDGRDRDLAARSARSARRARDRAAALFVAGGAVLYATNALRFGSGTEFGHRLNLASLPGNIVATRFSYPFERVGTLEAAEEDSRRVVRSTREPRMRARLLSEGSASRSADDAALARVLLHDVLVAVSARCSPAGLVVGRSRGVGANVRAALARRVGDPRRRAARGVLSPLAEHVVALPARPRARDSPRCS